VHVEQALTKRAVTNPRKNTGEARNRLGGALTAPRPRHGHGDSTEAATAPQNLTWPEQRVCRYHRESSLVEEKTTSVTRTQKSVSPCLPYLNN